MAKFDAAYGIFGARWERRRLLGAGLAFAGLALCPRPLRAVEDLIDFDVRIAGSSIGHHRLSFAPVGEELRVTVDVEMRVRMLFVTAFDYRQRTEERWLGERLLEFRSETVDGDNHDRVTAEAGPDGLQVESRRFGSRTLAADTWPTTAFWRPAAIERTRFLDAARGDVREVVISARGIESVDALGERRPARRYHVETSRDFDVWYGSSGEWLKLSWSGFGLTADYVRRA